MITAIAAHPTHLAGHLSGMATLLLLMLILAALAIAALTLGDQKRNRKP